MAGRKTNEVVLYIHGKGGSADESEHYRQFFPGTDVYGFDYKSDNPWEAKQEFADKAAELSEKYHRIILIAGSIGAYFSMNAGIGRFIDKAFFISPIVDFEKLISDMIDWAGTSECELEKRKIIPVDSGEDLSWDYLQYVRNHKISWDVPTEILYGSNDHLQSIDTIQEFAMKEAAKLTIMEGGEHWFHTDEQMNFLDQWLRMKISE
ncbi:alpha/beta hydrolase [Ruminococcus sp. YH-rum2234]|uniref:Alpha/beta hydrolase n=1 Tax=Fusibacillus kribbianus TaxID=3044208 RepID=A0AAP4EYN5_9FIRM|nr:alpha/beta hydrolase [Ruminococcus sp. YH-rum2234]MDI9242021.1 alpha/beta hydrolase [Ruminococcus sp. YH-rum2234]